MVRDANRWIAWFHFGVACPVLCREAGAASIIFASPMIKYPNVYGIDMPSVTELIAHGRTEEQVATRIGADAVVYNDLADLEEAVRECAPEITTVPKNRVFDTSCFNGAYVTGDINKAYFDHIEAERSVILSLHPCCVLRTHLSI
jgi:amidophosphoribosyltransferase